MRLLHGDLPSGLRGAVAAYKRGRAEREHPPGALQVHLPKPAGHRGILQKGDSRGAPV